MANKYLLLLLSYVRNDISLNVLGFTLADICIGFPLFDPLSWVKFPIKGYLGGLFCFILHFGSLNNILLFIKVLLNFEYLDKMKSLVYYNYRELILIWSYTDGSSFYRMSFLHNLIFMFWFVLLFFSLTLTYFLNLLGLVLLHIFETRLKSCSLVLKMDL